MTINVKSKLKKYSNITDAIIDYANEINDNFQANIVINIKITPNINPTIVSFFLRLFLSSPQSSNKDR